MREAVHAEQPQGLLGAVQIRGFRSARAVAFRPGPLCALVGEPGAGKSNVLAAMWTLLRRDGVALAKADASRGGNGTVEIKSAVTWLRATPPARAERSREGGPPVLFLPADQRSGSVFAPGAVPPELGWQPPTASAAGPANALVDAVERWCADGLRGRVLLIEEPELYLRPQAQRFLYRLLRRLAGNGNQVVYSTHSPAFLDVGRLEELAFVTHDRSGTGIRQPEPLPPDATARALSEFDAARSELFLARAVLLVEGRTEKTAFPYIVRALGHDCDREGVSIIECGGKPNIPLFARVCNAAGVPYLVVHDRDAMPGGRPNLEERKANAAIAAIAGKERTVVLEPDFEGVAGLRAHSHKPEQALRRFAGASAADIPGQLTEVARRLFALARR